LGFSLSISRELSGRWVSRWAGVSWWVRESGGEGAEREEEVTRTGSAGSDFLALRVWARRGEISAAYFAAIGSRPGRGGTEAGEVACVALGVITIGGRWGSWLTSGGVGRGSYTDKLGAQRGAATGGDWSGGGVFVFSYRVSWMWAVGEIMCVEFTSACRVGCEGGGGVSAGGSVKGAEKGEHIEIKRWICVRRGRRVTKHYGRGGRFVFANVRSRRD